MKVEIYHDVRDFLKLHDLSKHDLREWLKKDKWSIVEGCCIINNCKPSFLNDSSTLHPNQDGIILIWRRLVDIYDLIYLLRHEGKFFTPQSFIISLFNRNFPISNFITNALEELNIEYKFYAERSPLVNYYARFAIEKLWPLSVALNILSEIPVHENLAGEIGAENLYWKKNNLGQRDKLKNFIFNSIRIGDLKTYPEEIEVLVKPREVVKLLYENKYPIDPLLLHFLEIEIIKVKHKNTSSSYAEKECLRWLKELVKSDKTQSKQTFQDIALKRFANLSKRSFGRAWDIATDGTTWQTPGRPKKSSHLKSPQQKNHDVY